MSFTPIQDRIEYGGALIGEEEKAAINRVIDSQGGRRWTLGPESEAFENELAKTAGVDHAVVTNSGSSALLLAIAALQLPKGSKIIIPAVNFPTAFNAIIQNGHVPVLIDADGESLNLSLTQVKKAIEQIPDIQAVIAVDIAGNPVDLEALRDIVGEGRSIILDNCDGFGTLLNGEMIDQYADVSCVSFHAAHIITTGEGGAILTNDVSVAEVAHKLREWGRASGTDAIYEYPGFPDDYKERYVYEEIGYNLKPLELQCAMGRVQLRKLAAFRATRAINFDIMSRIFADNGNFQTVKTVPGAEPCWFSFPFLCRGIKRMELSQLFEQNNIETRTIFSGNVLKHPAYRDTDFIQVGHLHNANDIMENGMFLSVHPSLTSAMFTFIREVVESV